MLIRTWTLLLPTFLFRQIQEWLHQPSQMLLKRCSHIQVTKRWAIFTCGAWSLWNGSRQSLKWVAMLLKCGVSLILAQKGPGSYCSSPLGSLQLQTLWRQKYWRHHCYRHFFAAVVAVDVADAGVVVAAVVVVPTSRWSSKMQLFSQKFQTRRKNNLGSFSGYPVSNRFQPWPAQAAITALCAKKKFAAEGSLPFPGIQVESCFERNRQ